MPQLDPSSFISQIFWLLLSFGILYLLLIKIILPKIEKILSERQKIISDALDKAEQAKIQAAIIDKKYNSSIEEAKIISNKIIEEARISIKQEISNELQKLSSEIEEKLHEAEIKLNNLKADSQVMNNQVTKEIVDNVIKIIFNQKIDENLIESYLSKKLN